LSVALVVARRLALRADNLRSEQAAYAARPETASETKTIRWQERSGTRANLRGTDPRSTFRLAPSAREYALPKAAMGTAVA